MSGLEYLKSKEIISSPEQDVSTIGVLRAWWGRASPVALAAHVAAQCKNIQGIGDDMTALQDAVASGTATHHGGRVLRASKHAEFVVQEEPLAYEAPEVNAHEFHSSSSPIC